MKKEKPELLKWEQLPQDIKFYFLLRFIGVAIGSIALLIVGFIAGVVKLFCYIICILLGYGAFMLFQLYQVKANKYLVYSGICEKKHSPIYSLMGVRKPIFSVYGKSYILVRIEKEIFNVPVGNAFMAEEGDTIVFFANPKEIYKKQDNTWAVADTLIVKALKN